MLTSFPEGVTQDKEDVINPLASGDAQGEGNTEGQDEEELLKNAIDFLSEDPSVSAEAFLTGGHASHLEIPPSSDPPTNIPPPPDFPCPSGSSPPSPPLADPPLPNVDTNPPRSEEEEDRILRENMLKRMQDAGSSPSGSKGYLGTPWSEILAHQQKAREEAAEKQKEEAEEKEREAAERQKKEAADKERAEHKKQEKWRLHKLALQAAAALRGTTLNGRVIHEEIDEEGNQWEYIYRRRGWTIREAGEDTENETLADNFFYSSASDFERS